MKKWFLILVMMMVVVPLTAQIGAESRFKPVHNPISIGIKGGVLLPHYHYRSRGAMPEDLNELPYDSLLHRIRPLVGVQVEIPMGDFAYFAPELIWAKRGDSRLFYSIPADSLLTNYKAKVNYLDLRLPIEVVIPIKGPAQPYLFGGVDVGLVLPYILIDTVFNKPLSTPIEMNLSGEIAQETTVMVNKGNMSPFDFGVFGGAGVRYTLEFERFSLLLKLEAAYSMGLHNTYSKLEQQSQAPAVNLGNEGTHYSVGYRYNRGWECNFSVMLPLHFKTGDACSSFAGRR